MSLDSSLEAGRIVSRHLRSESEFYNTLVLDAVGKDFSCLESSLEELTGLSYAGSAPRQQAGFVLQGPHSQLLN